MKKAIFVITFVLAFSSLSWAQKNCSFDSQGSQEVPSAAGSQTVSAKVGAVSLLAGKVTDKSGAVVGGGRAALWRISKDGNVFIGSQQIDSEGNFCFSPSAGKYLLAVGADGYSKSEVKVQVVGADYGIPQSFKVKLQK